jgi:phospholipid/cholesterol/gamma-HCH transport system substrate-binding protein
MVTKSQKIRLGIFLIVSLAALIAVVIIIVAPRLLEVRDTYYIGFTDVSVTGLQEGGAVKYHGITVGYVEKISLDPKDLRRVIIELSLDRGTPIKEDTRAEIAFLGITGLKFIELKGGSNEAKSLKPGSFIAPGKSMTETVSDKAEVLAEKTEIILNNLATLTSPESWGKILNLADNASEMITELQALLDRNSQSFTNTLANAEEVSSELQALAKSDSLRRIVSNLMEITEALKEAELVSLIREMNEALDHTNSVLRDVEIVFSKSREDLYYSIESMRESADYLNQFSRMITEDPSILIRGAKPKRAPDFDLEKKE